MCARILCVGDLHVKVGNVRETRLLATNLAKIVRESDPDHIVILGDLLHRFNIIDSGPLTEAVKLVGLLADMKPLTVIIGNHDVETPSTYFSEYHPFVALKRWKNVRVIDVKCEVFSVNEVKFAAVPYIPVGRFNEALQGCDNNVRAIFCHQEFLGCNLGGRVSRKGDTWNSHILAISGHIHTHSMVGDNVLYVGTPRQVSFADTIDKTVSLVTFGADGWVEDRISTGIPPKILLEITSAEVANFVPPDAGTIRIKITGRYDTNSAIMSHPNVIAWKKRGIKVQTNDIMPQSLAKRPFSDTKVTFSEMMVARIGNDATKLSLFDELARNSL